MGVTGAFGAGRLLTGASVACGVDAFGALEIGRLLTGVAVTLGVERGGACETGCLSTGVAVTSWVDGPGALETGRLLTELAVTSVVDGGPRPGGITILGLVWPKEFGCSGCWPTTEVGTEFVDEGELGAAGPVLNVCRAMAMKASGVERFLEKSLYAASVHAPSVNEDEVPLTSWAS